MRQNGTGASDPGLALADRASVQPSAEPLCEDIAPARSSYRRTRGPQDRADPISRSVELSRPPSENLHPPGAQSRLVGEERSYLLEPVFPGFMKDPRRVTEGFRSLEVALSGRASDNRNRPADRRFEVPEAK